MVQGQGRVDNPEHYHIAYLADSPLAAVGEAFGRLAVWTLEMLGDSEYTAGFGKALARFELAGEPLDLDDPKVLIERGLRPSRIATQDRAVTQRWALRVWEEDAWPGVRWWSPLDADWGIVGLWEHGGLQLADVEELTVGHPVLWDAARHLGRVFE
jgi:hypothetical protein